MSEIFDGWIANEIQESYPNPVANTILTSDWCEAMGPLLLEDKRDILELLGVLSVYDLINK